MMQTPGEQLSDTDGAGARAESEAVRICQELIRIDSSNYGDGSGPGERACAEYIQGLLAEVGIEPQLYESADRRTTLVFRISGTGSQQPPLLIHGHTDVVPADAEDWTHDPFGGQIHDGFIWGRGAVDMKNMDAMILAVVRDMVYKQWRPTRDLVIAFFADEEAGGRLGSHWMVDHHPEVFHGVTEAVSEVGGYSVTINGRRAYLIQTAEKGLAWLNLVARGTAGHGSQVNEDNAVAHLVRAMNRIHDHQFEIELTPTVRTLLAGVAELTGTTFDPDSPAEEIYRLIAELGPAAKFVTPSTQSLVNLTQLNAGYKANVIPSRASGTIDLRYVPGTYEDVLVTLKELAGPNVAFEPVNEDIGVEAPFEGPAVTAMLRALEAEDPGAPVLPYMLPAGTDNKALSRLGIRGYGFVPLQLPPEVDFAGMFHGVDERVPISALNFGTRTLRRFIQEL